MFLFAWQFTRFLKIRAASDIKPTPPLLLAVWLLLALLTLSIATTKFVDTFLDRATVIVTKSEVKSGPQDGNATLIEIPEGSEVYVNTSTTNDNGNWKQITIPGNLTGWVKDNTLMMTSGEGPF